MTQWDDRGVALLGTAAFLTVPGLLLQVGLATAEMTSTFLLIAAAWHWTTRGNASLTGSVLSGILFGLSMATRMTALIALPAIVIWALLYARRVPGSIMRALLVCAVALVIFLLCLAAYYSLFRSDDLSGVANYLAAVSGASLRFATITRLMSSFVTSEGIFPISTMVAAAAALLLSPRTASLAAIRPLCGLLLLIAVVGWVAWIAKAPIPHLRYLWPALPALWLCGILLLLGWFMTLDPGRPRFALQAVVVAVWATQFALSFRQLAYGDSLGLVYEMMRQTPIDMVPLRRIRPFQARREQEEIASVVEKLPSSANILCFSKEVSYPLTWLTGRVVDSVWDNAAWSRPGQGGRYLIMFPSDKNIWIPPLAAEDWIQANTKLYSRFGDYSVYRINAETSRLPERELIPVGALPHPL